MHLLLHTTYTICKDSSVPHARKLSHNRIRAYRTRNYFPYQLYVACYNIQKKNINLMQTNVINMLENGFFLPVAQKDTKNF